MTAVKRVMDSGFRPLWRGWLVYATICDKSDCLGSTLLFFFVEPIRGWSTSEIQFLFILKECYTDMKWKRIIFKNLFLSNFLKHFQRFW